MTPCFHGAAVIVGGGSRDDHSTPPQGGGMSVPVHPDPTSAHALVPLLAWRHYHTSDRRIAVVFAALEPVTVRLAENCFHIITYEGIPCWSEGSLTFSVVRRVYQCINVCVSQTVCLEG